VLPANIARVLRLIWSIPSSVINLICGVVGPVLGNIAVLLFIAEWISRLVPAAANFRFETGKILFLHGLLVPVYLYCAVCCGFVARLAAASRFELKDPRYIGRYQAHRDSVIGFLLMLITWFPRVSGWVLACALVGSCIGWNEADDFIVSTSLRDPKFIRHIH
jgi:hypothetical protein